MSNTSKRNNYLDLVKGICLILIIFTHGFYGVSDRKNMLFPFIFDMAVPVLMIISGYLFAISNKNKGITSLKSLYSWKIFLKHYIRFTLPYLVIFFIEQLVFFISIKVSGETNIPFDLLSIFTGGYGPGSYYYPIMIEFIIIFPLMYFVINKYKHNGVILFIFINLVYEMGVSIFNMDPEIYRLLIFRYLTFISLGCYAGVKDKINFNKTICILTTLVGFILILSTNYLGVELNIFNLWPTTHMATALWFGPITLYLIKYFEHKEFKNIPVLCYMGKDSYNIYLVQMIYFGFGIDYALKAVIPIYAIVIVINLITSVSLGCLYYLVEHKLTYKFIKLLKI